MRYEKQITAKNLNNEIHEKLLTDCRDICTKLEEKISEECDNDSGLYNDLIKLAIRISDYVLADVPEVREEVNELMGGKILELESEKQRRLGREEGMEKGLEEGLEKGLEKGLHQGYDKCLALSAEILHMINEGEHDQIIIAEKCNCTTEEVETILKAFGI